MLQLINYDLKEPEDEDYLPCRRPWSSEALMVAEVDLEARLNGFPVKGAEEGLDPDDHEWLVQAGVL